MGQSVDWGNPPDWEPRKRRKAWLVWFAYYSEQADVGIVEADSADDACEKFWSIHGDSDTWPVHGVHAVPAVPGKTIKIHAEH